MKRFTFYFVVTCVAVGAYMLYVHQQQQQQQGQGQTAPDPKAVAVAPAPPGDKKEGFEPQVPPAMVPELPPIALTEPATALAEPATVQPRYGPRAFANNGGQISVSVGAVQGQSAGSDSLAYSSATAASWGSASEWAALRSDVKKAFAKKHAFDEASLKHQRSAKRCSELLKAIALLESAGVDGMFTDAIRMELVKETANGERLAQLLDVARTDFHTVRREFAMNMSAVFCAFNMLSDAVTANRDPETP
ncbi:hypothetical protein HXX76_014060 [Chlamydomonas incerta]|uniref:Uncharacterized protein n=1 Tax=Chlamydomonas incerta TaxID=51695 RepID=A0A835VPZ0_CHLIN|nr:hypothetical protein HXX76_014060 [Chlamydomonas incerta]|eukprot:KAG2424902.1 hypothetical protein HXX76_014060 [Chlamydomonas incerta]